MKSDAMAGKHRCIGLLIIVFLVASLAGGILMGGVAQAGSLIKKGSEVPRFELPVAGGGSLKLSQELGKASLLLLYWSLYCDYCREDLPKIQKMYERLGSSKVKVLAINGDGGSASKMVQNYWEKQRFTLVSLLDKETEEGFLAEGLLGVEKTPAGVLVSRTGIILLSQEGKLDLSAFEEAIRRAN